MKTIIDELDKLVYSGKENPIEISFDITNFFKIIGKVRDELQYADKCHNLEEELGCPLEIVFKALMNGIYIKNIDGEMVNFKCRLTYKNEELGWYFNIINGYVMVKDYKKTWWLKEDKSE